MYFSVQHGLALYTHRVFSVQYGLALLTLCVSFYMLVVWVFKGRKLTKIPVFPNTEWHHSLGSLHKSARIKWELNNSITILTSTVGHRLPTVRSSWFLKRGNLGLWENHLFDKESSTTWRRKLPSLRKRHRL